MSIYETLKRVKQSKPKEEFKVKFEIDETTYALIPSKMLDEMCYFCDDEGIKYGCDCVDRMIIPKEVFIEAFNKYIK